MGDLRERLEYAYLRGFRAAVAARDGAHEAARDEAKRAAWIEAQRATELIALDGGAA